MAVQGYNSNSIKSILTLALVIRKKVITVIVLIFSYFVGLGHAFIPHEHAFSNCHEHSEHLHNNHRHNHESKDGVQKHIKHNDHCDSDFFDFLYCFLSESAHPDSGFQYELVIVQSQFQQNWINAKPNQGSLLTNCCEWSFVVPGFNEIPTMVCRHHRSVASWQSLLKRGPPLS